MLCMNLQCSSPFTHVVCLDGEPHKKFRSLREAKWFTHGKDNATILALPIETARSVYEVYEEALF